MKKLEVILAVCISLFCCYLLAVSQFDASSLFLPLPLRNLLFKG